MNTNEKGHCSVDSDLSIKGNIRLLRKILALLLGSAILLALKMLLEPDDVISYAHAQGSATLREGHDYATLVLHDPWDMSEFTDISQYLNGDGQFDLIHSIAVTNGVFSAQSGPGFSAPDAQFYLLFPGYQSTVKTGKIGPHYPISSATYHCLYFAADIASTGTDYFQVFWYGNDHQSYDLNGIWGQSTGLALQQGIWNLYLVDLANPANYLAAGQNGNTPATTPWTGQSLWQGLRIDPTIQQGVNFSVDWARLTDCSAVNQTITWSGSGVSSLWLTSTSTGNSILAKTGLSGSPYTFDTEGLAPGTYAVCLSASTASCTNLRTPSPSSITIVPAPIATFNRPSSTNGVDYATQAGNTWDFLDNADVNQSFNTKSLSISSGLLNLTTASGSLPNGADPIIYLNAPQTISSGSQYRYLTYRIGTQGPVERFGGGMLVRWVWRISESPPCELVSWDIPFDVGWQIYTVDLFDPFSGSVETYSGCSPGTLTWSTSTNITQLRFDPNENNMGQDLIQSVDWIRLTQVDSVTHGTPYQILISLNKPPTGMSFNFYYTNDLSNPTQHAAQPFPPPSPFRAFLPIILGGSGSAGSGGADLPPITNGVTFLWNTTPVSPAGQYYVCVTANDGTNTNPAPTFCSEAPLQVN